MSNISYFQKYSQKENVHTNNALLLLMFLYKHNPKVFYRVLCSDNEDISIVTNNNICFEFEPTFSQQVKNNKSIVDGYIKQDGFQLFIETKDYDWFYEDQLKRHLAGSKINNDKFNIMLTLSRDELNQDDKEKFKEIVDDVASDNNVDKEKMIYKHLTFIKLVNIIENNLDENKDYQMKEIVDDFRVYIENEGLVDYKYVYMLGVADGTSIKEDIESGIKYYGGIQKITNCFMGLYSNKTIIAVGKIEKCIVRKVDENGIINYYHIDDNKKEVLSEDRDRIEKAMEESHYKEFFNYDHTFYITDEEGFVETSFKKESPYPLLSKKWFNLSSELGLTKEELQKMTAKELAEKLKDKKW